MATGQLYALEIVLVALETVVEGKLMAETLCKCFDLCEALLRHSYEHEHKADICHALLSIVENSDQAYPKAIAKEAAKALVTLCCGCTAEWKQQFLVRARDVLQQLPQELQDILHFVTDDKQYPVAAAVRRERSPARRTATTGLSRRAASPRERGGARSRSRSRERAADAARSTVKRVLATAAAAVKQRTDAVKSKPAATAAAAAAPDELCTAAAAAVQAEPVSVAAVPEAAAVSKVRSKSAVGVLKLNGVAAAAARVLAEADSCNSVVHTAQQQQLQPVVQANSMAGDHSEDQDSDTPAVSTSPAAAGTAAAALPVCGSSSALLPVNCEPVFIAAVATTAATAAAACSDSTTAYASGGLPHQVHYHH
jgi:hypothetical protein